jgi:hypothetical protein
MKGRHCFIFIVLVHILSGATLRSQEPKPNIDDREKLAGNNKVKDKQEDFGRYIYVSGEVFKPTKIDTLAGNAPVITLKKAIEMAGGDTKDASSSRILIIRGNVIYRIKRSWGNLDSIQLDGGDLVFVSPKIFLDRKLISPEK